MCKNSKPMEHYLASLLFRIRVVKLCILPNLENCFKLMKWILEFFFFNVCKKDLLGLLQKPVLKKVHKLSGHYF